MQLAYTDTGATATAGSSRVLVLLHGFPLSREMWVEQIKALGGSYRIITPDLRGHGQSAAPEGAYTMEEMADDVIELLDRLGVSTPVVLGGLSMGGYVALALIHRYPQRVAALMLLDTRPVADTPEAAKGREETAREVLREGSGRVVVETMLPRLFCAASMEKQPQRVETILAAMERTPAQGIAGALRGMAVRPDRRGELPSIAVPTLVLVGEHDVITPPAGAREMAAAIPVARFEIIPGAGHLAPYENPAAANRVILDFLTSLDRQPAQPSRSEDAARS